MGRPKSTNDNLPPYMRKRIRKYATYYFLDTGAKPRIEIPLGKDYFAALRKYAEIWNVPPLATGTRAPRFVCRGRSDLLLIFFGELLVDAMSRARHASKSVGGWGLFVDAKDEEAAAFYRKYGFMVLPSNPLILVMPFAGMPP